jgi:phosphatidylinositol alpha-1,6-mannosyltransferase
LRKRTRILYPAIDPGITSGIVRGETGGPKTVLFVGRLVKRKGMDVLLVAFRSLQDRLPESRLEIVGDGPERERVALMIAKLGLTFSVILTGTLKGKALYERFANADLFVMPSRATPRDVEGFGTVFLEAGLFGKPVIGTFSGGVPEAVQDGITGYLVREDSPEDLSAKMFELLTNDELAEKMGKAGRARAKQHFTSLNATRDLIRAIEG